MEIVMQKVKVENVKELYKECKGHRIDIYGAKSVAQRACNYLEGKGLEINGYLVSNRYDNPDILKGKPVRRIEEETDQYDCVILAVSGAFIKEAEKELEEYHIKKLIIIHPIMDDKFPTNSILSEHSRIAETVYLSKKVQIFSDDTSSIIIEDDVTLEKGVVIFATDHSIVHIKEGVTIGAKTYVVADGHSNILISEKTYIGNDTKLFTGGNAELILKDKIFIRKTARIESHLGASVYIGENSSFESGLIMIAAKQSKIEIGDDNMFSFDVKLHVGAHEIIEQNAEKSITNKSDIITEEHVWVGLGATLLPGCHIGHNSIVGAGSVVTKRIEPHCTCAGNPAKVLRTDVDWER